MSIASYGAGRSRATSVYARLSAAGAPRSSAAEVRAASSAVAGPPQLPTTTAVSASLPLKRL
ncbi:hypothetical protein AADR41_39680 [Streptomyces sp. CLV115]|uniref:hypothetical protein n=1 Tax=Streptomyces sp. CLV115 TaxID=3138502 RepID=UPI00313DFCB7